MQFTIGAFTYSVHRQWSLKLDGEPIEGYCASSIRGIFLDGGLEDDALLGTLRHEHAHAWEFEVGTPRTAEDRASFTATVGAAFEAEFNAQGGLAALKALTISGTRPTRSKRGAMNNFTITDRIECGWCGAAIMCGSIFTGAPTIRGDTGVAVVERGCQCPVCDRVQVWKERASEEGMPLGEYHGPRLLSGQEAESWLEQHRELHSPYNAG